MKKCEIKGLCKMLMSHDEGTVNLALQFIENFADSDVSTFDAKDFLLIFDKHYQHTNIVVDGWMWNGSTIGGESIRRINSYRYYDPLGFNLIKISSKVTHRKLKMSHLNLTLFNTRRVYD